MLKLTSFAFVATAAAMGFVVPAMAQPSAPTPSPATQPGSPQAEPLKLDGADHTKFHIVSKKQAEKEQGPVQRTGGSSQSGNGSGTGETGGNSGSGH